MLALRRTDCRAPMAIGLATAAIGLYLLAMHPQCLSAYSWIFMAAAITGLGQGLAVPASNNAGLHLAPDQVAAITGLRGMFRQSGSIVAVSVSTALLARSGNRGHTLAVIFAVFATVVVCTVPLVFRVRARRGTW